MAEIIWRLSYEIKDKPSSQLGKSNSIITKNNEAENNYINHESETNYVKKHPPVINVIVPETSIKKTVEPIEIIEEPELVHNLQQENMSCETSFLEEDKNVNMAKVRQAWLSWVNELRVRKGLQPLKLNNQLNRTANAWAITQRDWNQMTHKRTKQSSYYDYKIIENWFRDQGVSFTNVSGNTFSEKYCLAGI